MKSDAELLRMYVRDGSHGAFSDLVQRHISLVYGAALRQVGGDAHLAQDVAQTVFTDLARKASNLLGRTGLAGWLYLSTHHAAAQAVRSARRRRAREEAHAMQENIQKEGRTPEWDRLRPVLDVALREIGDSDREAVLLRFFEQRSYARVGAALNLSEDAARMRVDRALEKLRGQLERHGITSTAAALGTVLVGHACVAAPAGLTHTITTAALSAAGLPVATLLFMKTLIAGLATAAVVATFGVVYALQQAKTSEAALAEANSQRDVALAEMRRVRESAHAAKQRIERVEQPRMSTATAQPAANVAATPSTGTGTPGRIAAWSFASADGTVQGTTHFEDTPEGRRKLIRTAIAQTYGAFFRKMNWSEEQQKTFMELWADRKEAERVKFEQVRASGRKVDRSLANGIFKEAEQEFDAALQQALGFGAVEAKRDYEAKRSFRHPTEQLAQRLFYTDTPLSQPQAERLIDMMASNAQAPNGKYDIRLLNTETLLVQAQSVLSPPQLVMLREVEAERLRQTELELQMRAQQKTGGGVGTGTPLAPSR